jgi:hypothetical protein
VIFGISLTSSSEAREGSGIRYSGSGERPVAMHLGCRTEAIRGKGNSYTVLLNGQRVKRMFSFMLGANLGSICELTE